MSDSIGDLRQLLAQSRGNILCWLVLTALVAVSMIVAHHVAQSFVLPLVVAIAALQVGVLLLVFMHLRGARALILLTFIYASVFVATLFALSLNDLFTRV